jgi:hypothetical protein
MPTAPNQSMVLRARVARRAALIGLAVTIVGMVSYMPLMDVAWVRSTALPNTAAVVLGMAVSIWAVTRRRSGWTVPTGAMSVLLGGFFLYFMFVMAVLPEVTAAPAVGDRIAAFTLPNQEGEPVSLASLHENGPALLVFYRGHW